MDRNIALTIADASGKGFEFKSLRVFYEFVAREAKFWQKQAEEVQGRGQPNLHQFFSAANLFAQIESVISGWSSALGGWNDDELNRSISQLNQSHLAQLRNQWLWSGHPSVSSFIECHATYDINAAESFAAFVLRKQMPGALNNNSVFMGLMSAYEFIAQGAGMVHRAASEKASLEELREGMFADNQELISAIEGIKAQYSEWIDTTKERMDRLYHIQRLLGKRRSTSDENRFQKQIRDWSGSVDEINRTPTIGKARGTGVGVLAGFAG